MTSEDLRRAGYKPNNGLRDQRTALEWIVRYIAGFGGNPDKITVMGESAGAISASSLLCSERPMAKRLILLSGSPMLRRPSPMSVAEATYQKILMSLGIQATTVEGRIDALLQCPADDILSKLDPSLELAPVVDGEIFPGTPTFDIIQRKENSDTYPMPGRQWCSGLVIGHCGLDCIKASIFGFIIQHLKPGIGHTFEKSVRSSLKKHPGSADALLDGYGISGADVSDDDAFLAILRFANDICFHAPTRAMACGFPGDVFLYAFHEPNPWDGPFRGHATHVLDVAFLFQNFNDILDQSQKNIAKAFAKDVIAFSNGLPPYKAIAEDNGGLRVYSHGRFIYIPSTGIYETKGDLIFQLGNQFGLDIFLSAWESFLRVCCLNNEAYPVEARGKNLWDADHRKFTT
ncbi:hypothetical protein TPAR_06256 [Tolypocladium paradoxum]|uniref:Carboxylic ester hydrolase n=1 Tax=Tolypocladium paradoxum TaxID=94208 RepID=A0A2S4KTT0_9HYPO|nr:hypothetical protein TPAR_06256 [Tolypocladium paradoxum]